MFFAILSGKYIRRVVILIVLLFLAYGVFIRNDYDDDVDLSDVVETFKIKERAFRKETYKDDCMDLYFHLRNPNPKLIIYPPLKKIPESMFNEFTQNGEMPLRKYWYFNDVYTESILSLFGRTVKNSVIEKYRKKVRNNEPLGYGDKNLNELMHKYKDRISLSTTVVVGTVHPWVESIAYELGAWNITTLEYTRKTYEDPKLVWLHVNDFFDDALEKQKLENFDIAVSFSSIEHSGLGRFGDPLSPNGDLEAVRQVHCMLKPGGLFFLALPVSDTSYIEFNGHRVYSKARLDLMFKGWKMIDFKMDTANLQGIFVLEKETIEV